MAGDGEWEKMLFAVHCREQKTHGFEGCKNCDYTGRYQATYSKEGFCSDCEMICFPERFFPCPCCRLPQRFKSLCMWCEEKMRSYFVKCKIARDDPDAWSRFLKLGAIVSKYRVKDCAAGHFIRSFYQPTITSTGDKLPPASQLPHVDTLGKVPFSLKHWPGFYMGNGVWEKLTYLPELDDYGIAIKK